MKKLVSIVLVLCIFMGLFSGVYVNASDTVYKNFEFSGTMSKDVLRNYLSRAVTLQGFCAENESEDILFEEDLRMIRRVGAKFIGRAAYYSWGGNMSNAQIENHFSIAKQKADDAHAAAPELILQAGIFEIIYRGTVNSTPIPAWVLEEFEETVTERNFSFDAMLPPEGSIYGEGYWNGNIDTAVPYIGNVETQMYIYYLITRYIDAGYEAIHLGQVELIMNKHDNLLNDWDTVLTKARAYAKDKARRGIVLFDGHRELNSSGLKINDRMLMDFYSCGAVSHETEIIDDAECAEMLHYNEQSVSWIGRTPGGTHPLGFDMDTAFTLVEFDNFDGVNKNGEPHVASENDVYCWGYDIITWYATQPEWYRNQYLTECDAFLKSIELDSNGNQTYFIQPACRRVICPVEADYPVTSYQLIENVDVEGLNRLFEAENIEHELNSDTNEIVMTQTNSSIYRANYQGDGCVIGSNQEDTIRTLFLGADATEDSTLLPEGYPVPEPEIRYIAMNEFSIIADGNQKDESSSVKEYNESELKVGDLQGETKTTVAGNKTVRVLKAGQANTFKIEIDKNATAIQINDFKIDSADGELYQYHFYLSDDGESFNIIGSYDGSNGRNIRENGYNFSWSTVDQGWIRAQNNSDIVARAPLSSDGSKKVLYLKLSAKGGDPQNPDGIDPNAQIAYVGFNVQSVVPESVISQNNDEKEIIDEFRILTAGNEKDSTSAVLEYNENELNIGNLQGATKLSVTGNKTVRVLKAGEANVFRVEVDKNATSIQINDFKIDSADGELYQYHFYLSDDGENFNIIGSYDGNNRSVREHGDNFSWNTVDEGWIRAQNNADIVGRAPLNEDGSKKVLYIKLSAKGGDCQNDVDIDENAQISYVGFTVQSVVTRYAVMDEFRVLTEGNEKNQSSSIKEYNENELNIGDLAGSKKTSAIGDKTVRVLKAGEYNIFKIEINNAAIAIQLNDFQIDSADGELYQYHFYLSDDGESFNIIGSYDGNNRSVREHGDNFSWNTVDQGWIRAQNNTEIVGRAPLNADGTKKVLYLKLSAKGGDSQDDTDIDENAQISYVGFTVQSVVPTSVNKKAKLEKIVRDEFRILTAGNDKDDSSSVKEYNENELNVGVMQGEAKTTVAGNKTVRVLKSGQANVFRIEIDKNASYVQLNDFKIDSADGGLYQYHFYLSDDGENFNIIGSYDGSAGRGITEHGDNFKWENVDEGWIRAQNNREITARASLNTDGSKKVLYLKLCAKGGDPQNLDDIDPNAQISYVGFTVQSVTETPIDGDINCDGSINAIDLSMLRKYYLGDINHISGSVDVNKDGYNDARDIVSLKKYIAGIAY